MNRPFKIRPAPVRLRVLCLSLLLTGFMLVGCGTKKPDFGTLPVVSVPIERQPDEDPRVVAARREREAPPPQASVSTDLPDPPPLAEKEQFAFTVRFEKGEISVLSSRAVHLKQPSPTPRRVGRFAFELWSGEALIERVRFDFPLLGAGRAGEDDELESGLTAQTEVLVPLTDRANRARILDRKTREMIAITWPPESEKLPKE